MTKQKCDKVKNSHINRRQRDWGEQQMMDLDQIQYDPKTKKVLAFVETKFIPHPTELKIDLNSEQFCVLFNMAETLNVPLFCVGFYPTNEKGKLIHQDEEYEAIVNIQYYIIPINNQAKEYVKENIMMSELEWVNVLRTIRNLPIINSESDHKYYTKVHNWFSEPNVISRKLSVDFN